MRYRDDMARAKTTGHTRHRRLLSIRGPTTIRGRGTANYWPRAKSEPPGRLTAAPFLNSGAQLHVGVPTAGSPAQLVPTAWLNKR